MLAGTLAIAVIVIAVASPSGAISLPVVIVVYTSAQFEGRRRAALFLGWALGSRRAYVGGHAASLLAKAARLRLRRTS